MTGPIIGTEEYVEAALASLGASHYSNAEVDALLAARAPALVLTGEYVAPGTSNVAMIPSCFSDTYKRYLIDVVNLSNESVGNALFGMQFTINGGASLDGSSVYTYTEHTHSSGSAGNDGRSSGQAEFTLALNRNLDVLTAGHGVSGTMNFHRPPTGSCVLQSTHYYKDSSAHDIYVKKFYGRYANATRPTGFAFYFNSGDVAVGSIVRVYGVKGS